LRAFSLSEILENKCRISPKGASFGWVTAFVARLREIESCTTIPAQKAGFMGRGRARYQRSRVVATKGGGCEIRYNVYLTVPSTGKPKWA
jgi:hypothetical protein